MFVSVALSLVGQSKNINYVVARSFHGLVAPLAGWRFTVEGEEHLTERKGPAVVIGNHQTMIDILCTFHLPPALCVAARQQRWVLWGRELSCSRDGPVVRELTSYHLLDLGRIFPKGASIMAKKELQFTPLLGQFMILSNAVFVNRSKRADAVAIFAKVAETMKRKAVSSSVSSVLPLLPGSEFGDRRSFPSAPAQSTDANSTRYSSPFSSSPKAPVPPHPSPPCSRSRREPSTSPCRLNYPSSPSCARTTLSYTRARREGLMAEIWSFEVSGRRLWTLPAECEGPKS